MPSARLGPPVVGPQQFRHVMGQFVTGVTVVTACAEDGPHGTTVNSFTSLSLDPPLVMISLGAASRTAAVVAAAGAFTVNILSRGQAELGARFAAKGRPSGHAAFARVPHRPGGNGAPVLTGALAHLECRTEQRIPAGDHVLFVARVVDLAAASEAAGDGPLAFHQGRFLTLP
ncbi:flavin reductase family protein [Streptomyces sp. B1866]|uniref:flavin reductase family protein n=1 Tax=Streptomyces sp. B1866 TaxID=3075431 RepID=UPI00288CF2BE|nr:flavin reductase family protein [Streptomyces sp. B1866]MDT3395873.1 flavin reductase family protein [Streptomyces sp. B1866]